MSNYRTLENIIRDVVAKRTDIDEQRFSLMGAIRRVGKKPTTAMNPSPVIDTKDTDLPDNVLQKVLDPSTPEHHAHKEYIKRAQRKLKITD